MIEQLRTIFGSSRGEAIAREVSSVTELMDNKGKLGRRTSMKLEAILELSRLYTKEIVTRNSIGTKIGGPEDVYCLMRPLLEGCMEENFYIIMVTTKNRVIKIHKVSIGSLNAALVHPRETFREAVKLSAAGIIIVHNHPTGESKPSLEDINLTTRFGNAGEILGIDLVDHVIIGTDEYYSMADKGHLE